MPHNLELRLGIDVGGTHTDAVVLDRDDQVIAKAKARTTPDVTSGVREAISMVVGQTGVAASRISHVMLGTTHATNAVLERRRLDKVAVLRIGSPASLSVRPMFGWPLDVAEVVAEATANVEGGFEFDGREIVPFDHQTTKAFFAGLVGRVDAVAITSVFAPVSAEHEIAASLLARDVLGPDVRLSLSHEIGTLGLLARENATVLNAALGTVALEVAQALTESLAHHAIDASVLFTQNDGTLMALDYAIRFPILTIGSGPANSIRGAAFLTGLSDALVADVGGTSTDLGILVNGFPRESASAVDIGGISTNFRMPDVLTIALGGGSVVRAGARGISVGPDSVGYQLTEQGLVFGGDVPTLTDAVVNDSRAKIGMRAPHPSTHAMLAEALRHSDEQLAEAVDSMKLGRAEVPLIVVGGGSALVPDSLPGVSKVLRPDHFEVANAIGAAIAQVSGRWDEILLLSQGRAEGIAHACEQARARAIQAGADPDRIEIVEMDEIPLAYLTEPVVRISVKAVGPVGRF